jgi:TPR repeat protein
MRWYTKAADQGDTSAQYNLALMYEEGDGTAKDVVSAYMWYSLAAAEGDEDAKAAMLALAKRINTDQVRQADTRAKAWRAAHPNMRPGL